MTTTLPDRSDAAESTVAARLPAAVECLCPFCGAFNTEVGRPCRHCRTEDTTAARAAARKRVGPWFVLQSKNPAAPGMSLHALLTLIRGGTVTDRSVIRGPATGQLWRLAGKVRGISREFGSCYGCGGDLYAADPMCPHCQRPQSLPADIDAAAEPVPLPARPDRVLPRQDLLTPRDVAKAFSLGFGNAPAAGPVTLDQLLPTSGPAGRPRPTALAAATAAVTVAAVGWVLVHSLGRHPDPAAADEVVVVPPAVVAAVPPPRPAPRFAVAPPPRFVVAAPPPLVIDVPALPPARPAPPVAADEPAALTAGADESSATDDPKRLMAAGLAAEARGDYADAVRQYERLRSLSSDEWPAGLADRLGVARAAVRSGDRD